LPAFTERERRALDSSNPRQARFFANGHRSEKLALCRKLLDVPAPNLAADQIDDAAHPHAIDRCP
jgi:hypothetical protein